MAATKSLANLPNVHVWQPGELNTYDVLVSDWLIFSRMGTFDLGVLPEIMIWPLYFAAQLMIATGVVQVLRGETPAR